MKPGDPTNPADDGARADGLTSVGAEDIPELVEVVKPVPCTKTPDSGGEDVGEIDGDRDPE